MERVKAYLDTLTAPGMHGRGAEFGGDSIAAEYLAKQFEAAGLETFGDSYFQKFTYDINTFPGAMMLKVGKTCLVPGEDFIVESFSGGGKGKASLFRIDSFMLFSESGREILLKENLSNKFIVIESSLLKNTPINLGPLLGRSKGVIELREKLTMGLASDQLPLPWFIVKKEVFPDDEKKITFNLDARLIKDRVARNVIGYIPGSQKKDSFIVVSAHYDHLGRLGRNTYFPGANDNASGVSMLLELARFYSQPDHQLPCSIAFMAFAAEEAGLVGSKYYTENPLFPLSNIKFLVNLDLLGTGDDGVMVVNATLFPDQFQILKEINTEQQLLPEIKQRGPAANSDHYFFTQAGVPAFFMYTLGGITAYHDVFDKKETLPLTEFQDVFQLLKSYIREICK